MDHYGPRLSHILIMNFGGIAARSDLESLAEPLKKMVHNQANAKDWLATALASEGFPSQLVTLADRKIWLQKIIK